MLLNSFYTILQSENNAGQITARIKLNPQHEIFNGHFPGNPITPGVVQIQMIKEIAGEVLGKKLNLVSMHTCKFLKILNPVECLELNIKINTEPIAEGIKVNATGEEGGAAFFKISAILS